MSVGRTGEATGNWDLGGELRGGIRLHGLAKLSFSLTSAIGDASICNTISTDDVGHVELERSRQSSSFAGTEFVIDEDCLQLSIL